MSGPRSEPSGPPSQVGADQERIAASAGAGVDDGAVDNAVDKDGTRTEHDVIDDHDDDAADADVDSDDGSRDPDADIIDDRDWAWVQEWRASGEPPAWAPGLTLAAFTALVVGLAVFVLSTGLADIPWLAVTANVLVAAGLAPALWLSRHLPVLRWISTGAAVGVVLGWIAALIS